MTTYDVNKLQKEVYDKNQQLYYHNYEWLKKHEADPLMGWYFSYKKREMEVEENQRYWDDFFRNTGLSKERVRYPIRAGLYSVAPSETFEASRAVMSLYGRFKKWL